MSKQSHRVVMDELEPRQLMSTVQVADVNVTEGASAVFTLALNAASTSPTSISYSTKNGTAKAGKDFNAAKGTVTIPAGQLSVTVNVSTKDNTVFNGNNRKFSLVLKSKDATFAKNNATATIIDNESAPVLLVKDVVVNEGNKGKTPVSVTATLSNGSALPVSFAYATANDTTTSKDYKSAHGVVKFKPGATTAKIKLTVNGNTTPEPDKVFDLNLTNLVNTTSLGGFSRVVIKDDDNGITRAPATTNGNTVEAGTNATYTVTLANAISKPVEIRYTTTGGTATTAQFTPTTGVVTIPAGVTSKTFSVATTAGSVTGAPVTLGVTLEAPANATLTNTAATATITAPSGAPTPGGGIQDNPLVTLTANNVAGPEGNSGAPHTLDFVISMSGTRTVPVTVDYATNVDNSDPDHATPGVDFQPMSGSVTFDPGVTQITISVQIIPNSEHQNNRHLFLDISNAHNATIADPESIGTIIDDDPANT